MLLNTSLNIRGEPMVNDRADADRFETQYGVKVYSWLNLLKLDTAINSGTTAMI